MISFQNNDFLQFSFSVDAEGSSNKLIVMVAIILVICVPVVIFITYMIGKIVISKFPYYHTKQNKFAEDKNFAPC